MHLQQMNRRQALVLGATTAVGVLGATGLSAGSAPALSGPDLASLWKSIENIIQAQGTFANGVFSIGIDRNDINYVTLRGVPIKPAFQINGALVFQSLGADTVIMNSDMALKADEIDPFIDQLLSNDIVFRPNTSIFTTLIRWSGLFISG